MKDSALTIHGSLQAERLGKYLAKSGLKFTHVYASDLQRAVKTADAIRSWSDAAQPDPKPEVTQLEVLREQDFGYYEGRPFYARPRDSFKSGREHHRTQHENECNFRDVESKESMTERMSDFLRDHLVPLIHDQAANEKAIAIVSHGIILSHLWRSLLKMLPKDSVSLSPGISIGSGGVTPLEYLGGWSNTGYLELDIQERSEAGMNDKPIPSSSSQSSKTGCSSSSDISLSGLKVTIKTVNGRAHLLGLKRTKGGVGSARFHEGQKSIESFFKKRKVTNGQH